MMSLIPGRITEKKYEDMKYLLKYLPKYLPKLAKKWFKINIIIVKFEENKKSQN